MTFESKPQDENADFSGIEALLARLRLDSEKRGWKFYVEPPKELIPEFLGSYRPDAIGIGSDGGVIIEIKSYRNQAADSWLSTIAKKVAEQKGWDFRVFYMNPTIKGPNTIPVATRLQIEYAIANAETLLAAGNERAALLIGWSVLEALSRSVLVQSGYAPSNNPTPIQAVQTLIEEGYLEDIDGFRLRELTKLRSRVAHGDLSTTVSQDDVHRLIGDLRKIYNSLQIKS